MAKLLFASAALLLVALASADVVGVIDHFDNEFGPPCAEESNHAFFAQAGQCWNGTTFTCSGNWTAPIEITTYANPDCSGAIVSTSQQQLCEQRRELGWNHHTCSLQMPKFSNDMFVQYWFNSSLVLGNTCPAPIAAQFAEAHRSNVCHRDGFRRSSILTCAGNGMVNHTFCQDPFCQQGCFTVMHNTSCNNEGNFTSQWVAPMCSATPPTPIPILPGVWAVTQIYNNNSLGCAANPNNDLPNSANTYTSGACVRPDRNQYSANAWGRINVCHNNDQYAPVEAHYFLDNYCTYEINQTVETGCTQYNRSWPVSYVSSEFISCVDTVAQNPLPFDTNRYFASFEEQGWQCGAANDQEGDYWLIEQCHQATWGGYVQHTCQPNRVTTTIFNSSDCNPGSMVSSWWDPLNLCQYGGGSVRRVSAPSCAVTSAPPPANGNTTQYIKTAYTSDAQCTQQSSHVEMRVARQCQPLPNGFYFAWGITPIYNSYSYLDTNATHVLEMQYLDAQCTQQFNTIAYPLGCDSAQLNNGVVYALNSFQTSMPDTSSVFAHMSYNSPSCSSAPSVINTFPANACYYNGNARGSGGFGPALNYSKVQCTGSSWTQFDCRDPQCQQCFPRGNGQSGQCFPGFINGTATKITCPAAAPSSTSSGSGGSSGSSGPSGGMTGGSNYADHRHSEQAMVTVIIVLSVVFGVLALVLTFIGYRQGSRNGWVAV